MVISRKLWGSRAHCSAFETGHVVHVAMLRAFMVVPRLEYSPSIRHITLLSRPHGSQQCNVAAKPEGEVRQNNSHPQHRRLKSPPWSAEHELLGNMNHWAHRPCAPRAGSAWAAVAYSSRPRGSREHQSPLSGPSHHQANSTHAAGRCHVRADRPDRPQPSTLHPSPAGSSGRAVTSPQRGKVRSAHGHQPPIKSASQ